MKQWIMLIIMLTGFSSYGEILQIGTENNNPPFTSKIDNNNHYYGFDMEIMSEICKRIKAKCFFSSMIFEDLFPALDHNQIDLAIASIIITPERQESFLFSHAYLNSQIQLIALKNSKINTTTQLNNKRIGLLKGTVFKNFVLDLYKSNIKIKEYRHDPELLEALNQHEVDAIVLDRGSAQYWYANSGDQYKLIQPPITFGNGYGIAAKLGRTDLITRINEALKNMMSDGGYSKIYNNYFQN